MQGGSSGAAVVPGKPEQSRLFTLTNHDAEPKMPPKADKLAAANLETLRKWIEQGARENAGSKEMPKASVTVALNTTAKGRPEGPPPMPGKLSLDPIVSVRRPGAITALAASPWAPLVAIAGAKQISLYHSDTNELLGVLPYPHGQVNSLRFSRNGKLLLAAGGHGGQSGKATLFDLATGKTIIEVGQETDALLSADLSSDQSQIAVGSPSKVVRVYSTKDGSVLREIRKHTDWVTAVEYSPDGVLLASGDRNGGLFVWESSTGREFFTLKGPTAAVTSVSWRDDGNALAASSEDGILRLFEMENGTQTKTWAHGRGGVASVKYAHDGRLVSIGRDKTAKLWDAAGAAQKAFEPFPDMGLQVAISHDQSRVIAGDWSGVVKVWASADAKPQGTLDANPLTPRQRAERGVSVAEANAKQATEAFNAAKAAAEKATGDVAMLTKAHTDAVAAGKTANDALVLAKAVVEKANAALAIAQNAEGARAVSHQALAEAAAKVLDASSKQPQNAELKAQAAKVADIAKTSQGVLDAAKKETATAQAALTAAAAKHDAAQKTAAATSTVITQVQQKLTAAQATAKPLTDAVTAAQAKVTVAGADLEKARKLIDSLPKK